MSEFLGTKIDNIEVNDLVWRQKVNMNFMTLSAVQTVIANYTVDSSPPSPSTYDHTIFCNAERTYSGCVLGLRHCCSRKHIGGAIDDVKAIAALITRRRRTT